jgi:hypothetical protein
MSEIVTCEVHRFQLGDVDDVELYASDPIYHWQQTEAGKWVMENAIDIYWSRVIDHNTYGYTYSIIAKFAEKDLIFWKLKFK